MPLPSFSTCKPKAQLASSVEDPDEFQRFAETSAMAPRILRKPMVDPADMRMSMPNHVGPVAPPGPPLSVLVKDSSANVPWATIWPEATLAAVTVPAKLPLYEESSESALRCQ